MVFLWIISNNSLWIIEVFSLASASPYGTASRCVESREVRELRGEGLPQEVCLLPQDTKDVRRLWSIA